MSTLKVSQSKAKLMSLFEDKLDLSDIGHSDSEKDIKTLTRCTAAFAIYLLSGCPAAEAAAAVWDGSDDNGIDAAFFDPSEGRVIFVQSKWIQKGSGEPEAKDIGVFCKGVRDALEGDETMFHPRLHARFDSIVERLNTPGTKVHLVVVSTGASGLAHHGENVLKKLVEELNGDDPDPMASFEVMGLNEIFTGLVNDPTLTNLAIDATMFDWSYVSSPFPAYFGIVDGQQIKGWWMKYGKRLVSKNLRNALGGTEVNSEIRQTAITSPGKFWYFNNGITLVAEEAVKAPANAATRSAGVFTFKGASIVNGAQTASTLSKVPDGPHLLETRVAMRVILLQEVPSGFADEVTRTNNLQNRIEPRDFVAQDPEQRRLKDEMAIEGIEYQFMRGEEAPTTEVTCELIEVTTALACAVGDPSLAVQVKTGVSSRFFGDITKPPYKAIFNPSTSGARAFNATILLRVIESWIEKKKKLSKKSGAEWGMLVHGNRILAAAAISRYGKSKLDQSIVTFRNSLDKTSIEAICQIVHDKMVSEYKSSFKGRWPATVFKSVSMSKKIYDDALK